MSNRISIRGLLGEEGQGEGKSKRKKKCGDLIGRQTDDRQREQGGGIRNKKDKRKSSAWQTLLRGVQAA